MEDIFNSHFLNILLKICFHRDWNIFCQALAKQKRPNLEGNPWRRQEKLRPSASPISLNLLLNGPYKGDTRKHAQLVSGIFAPSLIFLSVKPISCNNRVTAKRTNFVIAALESNLILHSIYSVLPAPGYITIIFWPWLYSQKNYAVYSV